MSAAFLAIRARCSRISAERDSLATSSDFEEVKVRPFALQKLVTFALVRPSIRVISLRPLPAAWSARICSPCSLESLRTITTPSLGAEPLRPASHLDVGAVADACNRIGVRKAGVGVDDDRRFRRSCLSTRSARPPLHRRRRTREVVLAQVVQGRKRFPTLQHPCRSSSPGRPNPRRGGPFRRAGELDYLRNFVHTVGFCFPLMNQLGDGVPPPPSWLLTYSPARVPRPYFRRDAAFCCGVTLL